VCVTGKNYPENPIAANPSSSRASPATVALVLGAVFLLSSVACTTLPRGEAPSGASGAAAPRGFPPGVRILSSDRDSLWTRSNEILSRLRAAASDGEVDILAISGGGAGGAFGAGALVGLTRNGTRPQFELVTGVSTGALIAPFAFLGPAWDQRLTEAAMTAGNGSLLQWRGGILYDPAVYSGEPLARFVDRIVTAELVAAVAAEAAKGRMLLVATTDLDKEESVIWDLGAIASRGGEEARTLFRDVLTASASIPGVFPPVMIRVEENGVAYDEMHVDGGTIQSFFVAPEIDRYFPVRIDGLEGTNIYVIVNGQIGASSGTTPLSPIPILTRSYSATMKHISRRDIGIAAAFALRHGMNFHFTEIPSEYPFPGLLDFRAPTIQALFNYAVACAASGHLWTTAEQAMKGGESKSGVDGAFAQCPTGRTARGQKDLRKTARSPSER
jgi:predicted acylesterase/phospholipase RssA